MVNPRGDCEQSWYKLRSEFHWRIIWIVLRNIQQIIYWCNFDKYCSAFIFY